jgi:thiamine biosynthesis protein ThiS
MTTVQFKLNGKREECLKGFSLSDLLSHRNLNPESVATEVNFKIITKDKRALHTIKSDDSIEIFHFVGGG